MDGAPGSVAHFAGVPRAAVAACPPERCRWPDGSSAAYRRRTSRSPARQPAWVNDQLAPGHTDSGKNSPFVERVASAQFCRAAAQAVQCLLQSLQLLPNLLGWLAFRAARAIARGAKPVEDPLERSLGLLRASLAGIAAPTKPRRRPRSPNDSAIGLHPASATTLLAGSRPSTMASSQSAHRCSAAAFSAAVGGAVVDAGDAALVAAHVADHGLDDVRLDAIACSAMWSRASA